MRYLGSSFAIAVLLLVSGPLRPWPAALAQETAVAPEKNPPGDIPDNQVFIDYASPLGFSLKVPEGWARKESGNGVSFADKYGEISVEVSDAADALSVAAAKLGEAARLAQSGQAVKVSSVKEVKLQGGKAVAIAYTSNSQPNAVTGKKVRLENERYLFAHDGKQASLTFSAPAGADNADQWTLMAQSFRWK
jgi:hypothetical protein